MFVLQVHREFMACRNIAKMQYASDVFKKKTNNDRVRYT